LLQHAKRLLDELVLTDPRAVNYRVSLATVHLYLGNTLKQAGEAKEALGEFRSALSAFDARLQVQPDDVAASNGSLSAAKETSLLLAKSGDKTGSLELARKALLQAGNQPSGTAPTTRTRRLAEALLSLASIELQFGEWEAARNHGESAIGQFQSLRKLGGVATFVDEVARAERLVADCSARLP
jgi:tetratricopeptide (TPR) repeat protein